MGTYGDEGSGTILILAVSAQNKGFKGHSFFFFFKDPFSAIHKSQVALRLPFQIIAFLKLHERIQYIHLLGQVPATCSKLI